MALQMDYQVTVKMYNQRAITDVTFLERFPELQDASVNTINVKNAYLAIVNVTGDKNKVTFIVNVYDSADKELIVDTQRYNFVPSQDDNAQRWDKQAYEFLKTLDEYKDAIDV